MKTQQKEQLTALRKGILREIRRFGRDRGLMILSVITPTVITLLLVLMFAKGSINNIPIAIWDGDQTGTSRQLTQMLASTPSSYVALRAQSPQECQEALVRGQVYGFVLIPRGFEGDILSGSGKAQVSAYTNGAFITVSSILRRDFTTLLQATNIGVQAQILTARGIPEEKSMALAYPIVLDSHILFNPYGSYAYYLLPALLPLILIVVVGITTAYVIGSEFRYRTAGEWLDVAGGSITTALVSKLSPYFLLFCIVSLFMNTVLYRFMGLPFNSASVLVLLVGSIFLILSYMSIATMVVALTSNLRLSLSLIGAYTVAAFSFAGMTFPLMGMYRPIVWLSQLFPFTHYIDIFVDQSMRGAPIARSLGDLAILGCFILMGMAFIKILGRKAGSQKYYGKL